MLPIANTNIAEISDLTALSKTRKFKAEFYWGIRSFGAAGLLSNWSETAGKQKQ